MAPARRRVCHHHSCIDARELPLTRERRRAHALPAPPMRRRRRGGETPGGASGRALPAVALAAAAQLLGGPRAANAGELINGAARALGRAREERPLTDGWPRVPDMRARARSPAPRARLAAAGAQGASTASGQTRCGRRPAPHAPHAHARQARVAVGVAVTGARMPVARARAGPHPPAGEGSGERRAATSRTRSRERRPPSLATPANPPPAKVFQAGGAGAVRRALLYNAAPAGSPTPLGNWRGGLPSESFFARAWFQRLAAWHTFQGSDFGRVVQELRMVTRPYSPNETEERPPN